METFGQSYGYVLYRTQLPQPMHGDLVIKDIHDFAAVYINGLLAGALDRRDALPDGSLHPIPVGTISPTQLDILVANDGRVNVDHTMRTETKGITQFVVLDGRPLSDWQIYPMPMTTLPAQFSKSALPTQNDTYRSEPPPPPPPKEPVTPEAAAINAELAAHLATWEQMARILGFPGNRPIHPAFPPAFFRGHFALTTTGDTFLDTRNLGKGAVWINGHNLGRFWSVGPQNTLYVPGPWLRTGTNEIVVFDLLPQAHESIQGLDHPILDGPVSDKTISNQE
jgi:beta-galactosidase